VNRDAVGSMLATMRQLYRLRFPIRRMHLVDAYGADDRRSMAADNTSAFNCRFVAGSGGVWSEHAYGHALDLNPLENPLRHRRRLRLAARRGSLRRPLPPRPRPDPRERPCRRRFRRGRLGVGRRLVLAEGLPTLLGRRQVRAAAMRQSRWGQGRNRAVRSMARAGFEPATPRFSVVGFTRVENPALRAGNGFVMRNPGIPRFG